MVFRLPILVELKFKKVDFWEKGKTGVPKEKRLKAKEIINIIIWLSLFSPCDWLISGP